MRFSPNILLGLVLVGCGDKDTETNGLIDADGDGFTSEFDCDDKDETINPSAEEICDGLDNNCNEELDESPSDGTVFYADTDGDGFGNPDVSTSSCDASVSGYVDNADDCNDSTSTVYPGGTELCDGFDNDCDGEIDNGAGDILTFYADTDADGYGDPNNTIEACAAPSGYVADYRDCDDADASVNPDTLWYPDNDYDGFGRDDLSVVSCEQPDGYVQDNTDCDDENIDVNPAEKEICDGIDTNCDGKQDSDDIDGDLDGQAPCQGDCDDLVAEIFLGSEEICDDGLDNDCDGRLNNTCPADITSSDVTITGSSSYSYLGYGGDVADVNGDGDNDLIIGAYGASTRASYGGEAYVFFGPLSGTPSLGTGDADVSIAGTSSYDYLGAQINSADLNGDAYMDLVIHARDTSYGGYLYVFYGPITGSTDVDNADAVIMGNNSDYLGYYGFETIDVDGDGNAEIVAGAHNYDYDGTYSTGIVGVWSDPSGEMDYDDADASAISETSYAYVGYGFSFSGDLDGDGNVDLAWSEPGEDLAYINYGPVTGEFKPTSADVEIVGSYNDYTGSKFATGDLNGDGYDDVIVAGMYASSYLGEHNVYYGPVTSDLDTITDPNAKIIGAASYDYVGYVLDDVDVADVDGDGFDDFAFGVGYDDTGASSAGGVFMFYGPISGSLTTANFDRAFFYNSTYGYMGRGVTLDDVTGDGNPDLITGAYGASSYAGQMYVFFNSQL